MIHVIATIEVFEGKRQAFIAEFQRLVPHVLGEKGCLEYGPNVDIASGSLAQIPLRDHVVTIAEKWETLEALKAHFHAPHMAEYRTRVETMVKSVSLQVLEPAPK